MDETDLRLLAILNANSRTPFRELAEKLGISVQAVHKRVQALTDSHVIACFTAELSFRHLGAVPVGVFGISRAKDLDEALRELGRDGRTHLVHGSGDYVATMAVLRSISDLEDYVESVKRTMSMESPSVGIPAAMGFTGLERTAPTERTLELTPLDYRIVHSLRRDARKEVTAIAQELGVTAATVRRRLARLTDARAVDFSTEFHPGDRSGFTTMTMLRLRPGADKAGFLARLRERYGPRILFMTTFSNIADTVAMFVWSASMRDSREMEASFRADDAVESFNHYLIQYKHTFPTWRDRLLEERAREAVER